MTIASKIQAFQEKLLDWYAQNKRDLPFRGEKDPYRIWVSEVLLQQTQMSRGVEYYNRFVERFPTVASLAKVSWEEFLPYFRGLGFYNRGRNMLRAAKFVVDEYDGTLPDEYLKLTEIPGVGPYTANAILSFAYGRPVLTHDTNVVRILDRVFDGREGADLTGLTKNIEQSLVAGGSADLNQAMMDLGSSVCLAKAPRCERCPLRNMCSYGQSVMARELAPPRRVTVREPYTSKCPVALIHHEGGILLPRGRLPSGPLSKGDERAFLKALAEKELGLEISVRPPFLTWITRGIRYSAHRCRILRGVPSSDLPMIEPSHLCSSEDISRLM